MLIFMTLNLRLPTLLRARHMISLHGFVIFCGKARHIRPNYNKLQAAKRANKPKVPMPQAQDPMVLIGELVKALNLYTNARVAYNSNMNNNSKAKVASKRFWMQKAQSS